MAIRAHQFAFFNFSVKFGFRNPIMNHLRNPSALFDTGEVVEIHAARRIYFPAIGARSFGLQFGDICFATESSRMFADILGIFLPPLTGI